MNQQRPEPFKLTSEEEVRSLAQRFLPDPEAFIKKNSNNSQYLLTRVDKVLNTGRVFSYILEKHADLRDPSEKVTYLWKFSECVYTSVTAVAVAATLPPPPPPPSPLVEDDDIPF